MGNQTPKEGKDAYEIALTKENLLGAGNEATVYKIKKISDQQIYAGKFSNRHIDVILGDEKVQFERGIQILQE